MASIRWDSSGRLAIARPGAAIRAATTMMHSTSFREHSPRLAAPGSCTQLTLGPTGDLIQSQLVHFGSLNRRKQLSTAVHLQSADCYCHCAKTAKGWAPASV